MFRKAVLTLLVFISLCYQALGVEIISKAGPPEPATLPGYERAHCVSLPDTLRICKCLSDTESVFVTAKAGKLLGKWPAAVSFGDTSDFEVLMGDLDGDQSRELMVANHDGTSNGVAISYWTISIFPDLEMSKFQRPLMFSVEEYGSFGTFVTVGKEVRIFTTRWLWGKDPKGKRGLGFYLVGQMWRYSNGMLRPATRQVLARRYLESFAEERGQTRDASHVPYRWFKSPRTELRKRDPLVDLKIKSTQDGIIRDVVLPAAEGDSTFNIVFQADGAQPITYTYPAETSDTVKNAFRHIGERATNAIYPDDYIPSQPSQWLKGRRARLITYHDEERDEDLQVLWLL